jgi:hypothetical protein
MLKQDPKIEITCDQIETSLFFFLVYYIYLFIFMIF